VTTPAAPPLHMLAFRPDMAGLMRLAHREHLLPPGDDPGYALHAILAASFHELAPQPFALLPPGTQGRDWTLLAYSLHPLEDLRAHALAFADPGFLAPLDLAAAAGKTMPAAFPADTRLSFRVRVRPVVRTGKPNVNGQTAPGSGRAREVDAYQSVAIAAGGKPALSRGEIYTQWLTARLTQAGAAPEMVSLEACRRVRLMSRDRSGGAKSNRYIEGPEAVMTGALRVTDPDAFAQGLARGIGRHRAFGFGMLLLAPPR
jgi:CRISPR system Cascade subunit CasE